MSIRAGACRLGPERVPRQQPDLPLAGAAEGQVLRPAADAVHGGCQGQQLGRRAAAARSAALGSRADVVAAVPGRPGRRRSRSGSAGPAGAGGARTAAAGLAGGFAPACPCGMLQRGRQAALQCCGAASGHAASLTVRRRRGSRCSRYVDRHRRMASGAGSAGEGRVMGPLSCGDQPFPSRWKIPSADCPKISSGPLPALRAVRPGHGASCWGCAEVRESSSGVTSRWRSPS